MEHNTLKDRILYLVEARPGLSMVELIRYIPEVAGSLELGIGAMNLVIWRGLSAEAVDAIKALLDAERIRLAPCSAAAYLVDGGTPDLPQAKKVRRHEKPHWLPVSFSVIDWPPCDLTEAMQPAVNRMEEQT